MLRLPPTTIHLDRRDLDWHYTRSLHRARFQAHNQAQRFINLEWRRRNTASVGRVAAALNQDSIEDNPAQAQTSTQPGAINWEEIVIRSRYLPHETASSLTLPLPRVRPHQQSESESSESPAYDTPSDDNSDGGIGVSFVVIPNIRQQDGTTEDETSTTSAHFDGNYDDDDNDDSDGGGAPLPLAPHPTPAHAPSSAVQLSLPPVPLPSRLRTISGTAPQLGSPLRFIEAVQASSSPERPTERTLDQLRSLLEQAQSTPRGDSSRRSDMRIDHSNDRRTHGSPLHSATDQQLEVLSRASNDDLQRFRNEFGERYSVPQIAHRLSLRLASGETASSDNSTSGALQTENGATNTGAYHGHMMEIDGALDGFQHSASHRVQNRSLRVYDDEQSPTSQPQTPVGLPRHGVMPMPPGSSFTAPPRRPHRLPNAGSHRIMRIENGRPVFYRRLEGDGEQENIDDSELFRRQEEARRQQLDMVRRAIDHILETTPPSRNSRDGRRL